MPPEYANRMSTILCHDCDVKNDVPFHFIYHKCPQCKGYNTRVLAKFDRPPPSHQPGHSANTNTISNDNLSNRDGNVLAVAGGGGTNSQ